MTDLHLVRNVNIAGMTARARVMLDNPGHNPNDVMTVKTAAEVDKALGDDGNEHCCPLCGEFFGTAAFKAHAVPCINARAPRGKIWSPPGFSGNAIQHYSEERPSQHGGRWS